jgi:hypothetical protein
MKRNLMLLAAGVAASMLFTGCASTGAANQTPAQLLAEIHSQVSIACTAAGPSLTSIKSLEPGLTPDQAAVVDQVYTYTTAFCAAHETVSVASITAFANTAIPAGLKLVNGSSMSQDDKTLIAIGAIALQTALNTAVAQYNAAQPAMPASAVPAA